jgi:hypothetical protein
MPQLTQYIDTISRNDLLVPDFQRGYVWNKQQQKELVASVLSGLPLGALLIVEGNVDDFLATKLGTNIEVQAKELRAQTAKFLVDGQQRLTTLVNVFSNFIHYNTAGDSEMLKGDSLRLRWVLKIPRPKNVGENDVFGVKTLEFSRSSYIPTVDLIDYIDAYKYDEQRGYVHSPEVYIDEIGSDHASTLSNSIIQSDRDYYIIPLYLFCDQNKRAVLDRELFGRHLPAAITDDLISAEIITEQERREWRRNAAPYWNDISYWVQEQIDRLNLQEVQFAAHERERAIEAYECMNRGGVALSIFDLLIAKASRADRQFLTHFIQYIDDETPDCLNRLYGFKHEGARKFIDSVNSKDFIYAFRNLLGLYVGGSARIIFTKEEYILNSITSEQIIESYMPIIDAMERAAQFLQERCGVQTYKQLQYKLMFVVVAYYYLQSEENVDKRKLEAWWWSALFSAQFSRLANVQMIESIELLISDTDKFTESLASRIGGGVPMSLFEGDLVGEVAFTDVAPRRRLRIIVDQFLSTTNVRIAQDEVFTEEGFVEFTQVVNDYIRTLL